MHDNSDQSRFWRWWTTARLLASTAPWLALYPIYSVGVALVVQAGSVRALGVAAVASVTTFLVAGLIAIGVVAASLDRRSGLRHLAGDVLVAVAALDLAMLGLAIFGKPGSSAAASAQLAAVVGALAIFTLYRRNSVDVRVLAWRGMTAIGWVAMLAPLAGAPLVVAAGLRDQPHLPAAIPPLQLPVKEGAPRRIVLVTFDSLRAASCTLDGKSGPTPHLAALAREADRYARCVAPGDQTRVSMPVILSGLAPQAIFPHLPNNNAYLRQESLIGLAGHLRPAGYHTAYATGLIDPRIFGMNGEYDGGWFGQAAFAPNSLNPRAFLPLKETATWLYKRFIDRSPDVGSISQSPRHWFDNTSFVFEQALPLITSGDRTFTWIHCQAPHDPYYEVPPARFDGPHQISTYNTIRLAELKAADDGRAAEYLRVYEAYVRYADHLFGRLMADMKANGIWDESLIVVTSDHGEGFTPGKMTHCNGHLSEDVTQVPLLIKPPGRRPGQGRLIDATASGLDIVPTVLHAVYGVSPTGLPGHPLLASEPPPNRVVFSYALPCNRPHEPFIEAAAYQGRFKYLLARESEGVLYDLGGASRSGETLLVTDDAVAKSLDAALRAQLPQ